jgi:hypothetical protein
VRTPRSFSALAMFLRPLTPAAWICRTIGSTFAAKASAAFLLAAVPLAQASARLVRLPSSGALHA